jgi:hypothetical protein
MSPRNSITVEGLGAFSGSGSGSVTELVMNWPFSECWP